MGPIWATRLWANPYGTHVEPSCTPHMGAIWVAHGVNVVWLSWGALKYLGVSWVFRYTAVKMLLNVNKRLVYYK